MSWFIPSLHEGSALAIYEGLASGLPVITTKPSGSVVRDGIEGRIVPIRNVDALAAAMSDLYHNHEFASENVPFRPRPRRAL